MSTAETLLLLGALFLAFAAFTLFWLRREYAQRGRLSAFGSALHLAVYCVNGAFVGISIWGPVGVPPMRGVAWLGVPLMVGGLALTVLAMDCFRQFSRWLGNATPGLKTGGLYRYSRNPQFVAYGALILGAVIAWGNPLGVLGLASYLALAYAVARIEEEHLARIYGQDYLDYCARVPRFVGWPGR